MDETKLRYFISVAKYSSFSKAAQELHVVQPTVSRQITLLEESLGTPLFYRDTHRVELTPAGQRLYKHAYSYLIQYQSLRDTAQNLMLENETKLHINCGPVEFALLEPLARLYRQAAPEAEFCPIKSQYDRAQRNLISGSHHLLVTTQKSAQELTDFHQLSLGTHRWKAVTHRDSDFWGLPPEKQAVLWGQKAVRFALSSYDPMEEWFRTHPMEYRGIATASAYATICLQANLGAVAILPEYLEPWLPASLRMEQVFPDPLKMESVLILNQDRASESERHFFDFIRDHFKP